MAFPIFAKMAGSAAALAFVCVGLLAATTAASNLETAPLAPRPAGAIADLVVTGNRMSELEPCGCNSDMQGGIDHEAGYIEQLAARSFPLLRADAGGFIKNEPSPNNYLKSQYLLEAMGRMGYDVINVGLTDMAYGLDFLREQARANAFELISASLLDPQTNEPLFAPYVIREFPAPQGEGTVRVALTGFTRPGSLQTGMAVAAAANSATPTPTPQPTPTPRVSPTPTERTRGAWVTAPGHLNLQARITPTPPPEEVEGLRRLQEAMQKQQEVLIGGAVESAAEQRMAELRAKLAQAETLYVPTRPMTAPTQPAQTPDAAVEMDNGQAPAPSPTPFHGIEVDEERAQLMTLPSPKPGEFIGADPQPILERLIPELRQQADYVVVLGHFPRQNAMALLEEIEGIDLLIAGYGAEEPVMRTAAAMAVASPGYSGRALERITLYRDAQDEPIALQGEIVPVNSSLPQDAAMAELMAAYREDTQKLPKPALENITYTLAGAESCKVCHETPSAQWKETRHAHAFQTLVERSQHFNPDCLPCHTTSYMKDNGFRDITITRQFTDVQCEVCHGPALQHVINQRNLKFGVNFSEEQKARIREQITSTMPVKTPPAELCVQCHTEKTDPRFDYDGKVRLVWHETGPEDTASEGKVAQ